MSVQLEAAEKANGASFDAGDSRLLPQRFGALSDEWAALRHRCGLYDAGFRALWRLSGSDRTTFLQGMVSNDVAKLGNGSGTYAALLTIQGRIVSDLRVFVVDEEVWLDVPASHGAAVRENLEKYIIADDVEFVDDDAWCPLVGIEGPQADRVMEDVGGESLRALPLFAHRPLTVDGSGIRVAVVSQAGERGYLMFGPPSAAPGLWERCRSAGAEPVGMHALDVLRIEAGIPWMGRDMDESTLVSEAGLEQAISFKKGCYLGQEVVERVAARGQVQRKLVGLDCAGDTPPPAGAKLVQEEKEVGWISSAVHSPADGVIALGYVRRECWDVGTELRAAWSDHSVLVRVASLPFYRSAN
ncbi:MAG: aminomethyl transferase family protein [Deltaproteobacteria bacterium]|nr:aminomethyl transferase family protein [Deltaproteobacteria bacterium]